MFLSHLFYYCRDLEEALEMGMDWSLREGEFIFPTFPPCSGICKACPFSGMLKNEGYKCSIL